MHSENVSKVGRPLQDPGAETAILAGICKFGKDAYIDVSELVSERTFTVEENKILFKCLEQSLQHSDVIDVTSIINAATELGVYQHIFRNKKDNDFIKALFNFHVELENIRVYAKKIAKLELARLSQQKLKDAFDKLNGVTGSESVDSILAIAENPIFQIIEEANRGKGEAPQLIGEGIDAYLQHIVDNPREMAGLPTPWPSYNYAIGGGIRRGGVNLIGARPKKGKTTLGKEGSLHFTMSMNVPVLYLDTEMVKDDHVNKSLSSLSGVPIERIETGKFASNSIEAAKVYMARDKLKSIPFYHMKIAGKPFEEVLSIIRRWILREVGTDENGNTNHCLVIYDYFKIMDANVLKSMQEYQALGFQISALSDFTKQYDFACMAFVQLNRDGAVNDVSEIVSGSDRLLWLCHSFSTFRDKLPEEIAHDGSQNGNKRLKVLDTRFGPGMADDDYINLQMDGDVARIKEVSTRKKLRANNGIAQAEGFEVEENDDNDGPTEIEL